jgi:hypothetical protein
MPRSTRIDPATRAAAVADLMAGEQPALVAAKYGIDAAKVRMWKTRYVAPDVAPDVAPITYQQPAQLAQKQYIGELIVDLLRAKLEASQAIARAARNPEWLAKQSAADLAALGGYLDSTAFAIGDRLAGAATSPDADDTEA